MALPAPYDAEDPDACPECAQLVRSGQARDRFTQLDEGKQVCGEVEKASDQRELATYECVRRWRHRGLHRRAGGATWAIAPDDVTPPPDGFL